MSKHSQPKNFKKPPTSWRNAQSQIPQNGSYSTSGPRPPKGSPQFNVPTTPPLNQQPGMQRTQQRYPAGPGVPPSYTPSPFSTHHSSAQSAAGYAENTAEIPCRSWGAS